MNVANAVRVNANLAAKEQTMRTTMPKLRRTIRRVIKEQSVGVLMISGNGEKFAITNTGDYFSTSVYDDDFRDVFISELEKAREQGYENVQLASGPMNTEYLTIDEMIQRVEEIETSMY